MNLHIRLSTIRNFGPFWENDLRHTPQHFRILIFLLWHYIVVIMIIVEFSIEMLDLGVNNNNKSLVLLLKKNLVLFGKIVFKTLPITFII